jgi:hypothetical protein
VRSLESSQGLCRKVVVAARLLRGEPLAEAGKRERVVAHGTDVMLRLPDTTALDACAGVERVDDAPTEEVARDRRCGNLGLARRRLTEQQPESWPGRTKPRSRRHREIELKRVRQQEHPVGGRTALEVDEMNRIELSDERARPVIEHVGDPDVVGDAEGEVQVGEAVPAVHGERAHSRSGNHVLIGIREP